MRTRLRWLIAGAAAASLSGLGFLAADVFASASGAFTYTGTVVHVVDGDTLDVQVPGQGKLRVRVVGIDTPERGACYFSQATKRANLLANGKRVVLHGDRTQATRDRYGRLLAYVDIGGNVDLGLQLIQDGFGKVYVYGGKPFLRVAPYRKAQQLAQSTELGLWNCGRTGEPIVLPAAPVTTTTSTTTTETTTTSTATTTTATTATSTAPAATTTAPATATTTTTTTAATTTTAPPSACDASYPDFCIPPPPPDLDCKDIPRKNFTVRPPDPHGFDGDKDGIGCESSELQVARSENPAGAGLSNGEGGIRTLEAAIQPPNALAGRRLQPLGHFSGCAGRVSQRAQDPPFSGRPEPIGRGRSNCR